LKGFWLVIFLLALLGAYLTLRQWEQFLQTFLYFYSVEGAVYFALSLTMVKAGHELAHAYTAKNFGLKVPVMGVAFIIFWPVLYTDTTDAWKLTAKKQRLQIGIAGVAFELAAAVFATLLWHLLPMGPWKGAMFMLASSTWILTLTINLNPFMRFDGYYILSDLLGIPNLQQRSFELARWFLRRFLLGADLPCPENLPWEQRALLIAYGYAVWAYRLFLYSGIALLVYHFFFKVLGLLLFAGEIGLLICLPIMREIKVWFRMRSQLKGNVRMLFSAALLLLGLALFFFPWNTSIHIPAVSKARNFSRIFAPEGARIKENLLARGREVKEGEALVVLDSPEIEYWKKQAAQDVQLLQTQISRSSFFEEHAEQLPILEQELVEALTALAGAGEQEKRLTIRSPIRGVVSDVADSLVPGRWLKESDQLAAVVDLQHPVIEGYVHEQDRSRILKGQRGIFYPSDTEVPEIVVEIKNIAVSHTSELDAPYLASVYGGDLPVRVEENGALRLQQSLYKVEMEPIAGSPAGCILRGTVKIRGNPVSIAARAWTALQAVVIRESGF
jgi:putative peptide zinc metalloprotease protein